MPEAQKEKEEEKRPNGNKGNVQAFSFTKRRYYRKLPLNSTKCPVRYDEVSCGEEREAA